MMLRHFYSLAKSRKSKSFTNKSIKQSKKSARGQGAKKKGLKRRTPAGKGRLGGGGPAPHLRNKPTPAATPEPEELTPGSPEETSLRETESTHRADEMEP
jgi:hypothetical protein